MTTYCLFFTCKKAMSDKLCTHSDYPVVEEVLTKDEAEKMYPDAKFCKDWEFDEVQYKILKEGIVADD